MGIDISQFHQVFFEESFEGLDIMESGLLDLDIGEADLEAINTIFRAAHSIKGGGGTFGFTAISDFTHVAETLLDEVRAGKRQITRELVDILLESVDCLRDMLAATRDGEPTDEPRIADLQVRLENELHRGSQAAPTAAIDAEAAPSAPGLTEATPEAAASVAEDEDERSCFAISFEPHPHMFRTGNDPVRIFRELAEVTDFEVKTDITSLPPFTDVVADECYLKWELVTTRPTTREQIVAVFDWVEGDCDLSITAVAGAAAPSAPESNADAPACSEPTGTPAPNAAQAQGEAGPDDPELPAPALAAVDSDAADRRSGGERRKTDRRTTPDSSIRVSIDKVDGLINLVGELVITQSMLGQIGEDLSGEDPKADALNRLRDGLTQLERNTREMQESVMRIRMLPISFVFQRFPRLVRDLSNKLGRQVDLQLLGEQTELDKTVMEKIGDPLVHLVRNALDHGIEPPELRSASGKPETGTLTLHAYHEGGNIVIEIADDGAGLNCEKLLAKARERGIVGENEALSDDRIRELIFHPGFSTAQTVSDVSGRGVGMDVVRRNIKDLGGSVEIASALGEGTTFTIRLPLTLAILDGQLVRVGNHIYIVPLVSIVESLQVEPTLTSSVAGKGELYRLRDEYIPVVRLYKAFNVNPEHTELHKGLLVVVEGEGVKAGIFVDDLLAQQQVVIKSLESNFRKVEGISGATILGDGTVAMILDIPGLIALSHCDNLRGAAA